MNKRAALNFLFVLTLGSCGGNEPQEIDQQPTPIEEEVESEVVPSKVDFISNVEVDFEMDISSLSLSDLRLLRSSVLANKGYCFMEADLRGYFMQTDWYEEKMYDVFWNNMQEELNSNIELSDEEKAFVERVSMREKELLTDNILKNTGRSQPNLANIANLFQFDDVPEELLKKLGQNGFVISENNNIQLFHTYEENDYHQIPNFVTTDMYMQLFHMYFGYILRQTEQDKLLPLATEIARKMSLELRRQAIEFKDETWKKAANRMSTFYAIAYSVFTDNKMTVPNGYHTDYVEEIRKINAAKSQTSKFLKYELVEFPYDLFKPRGHYTRNKKLIKYFKGMMWLQTATFCLDDNESFIGSVLSAEALNTSQLLRSEYQSLTAPIDFLIGLPDNVSFLDVAEVMTKNRINVANCIASTTELQRLRAECEVLARKKNRIKPDVHLSCEDKINFLPQRYLPDNEVLQAMYDRKSQVSKRAYPKGLDVLSAFGSSSAKDLLLGELEEDKNWSAFSENMIKVTEKVKGRSDKTVYNQWIESLVEMQKTPDNAPYFMLNKQWEKKDLNAALASWAELKHDALLYAEQPIAAECGGGGPPSPYTVGYVEPNIVYWQEVLNLIEFTQDLLQQNKLLTEECARITEKMKENAQFLLNISEKELAGVKLKEIEYRQIERIGSAFEWITLDLVREKGQFLTGWDDVRGADKSISVVADVFTSNHSNNPNKGILHVGTGPVDDIYVLVEIEGYLYLTKGAVFSYREFTLPLGNRLTDEEWQKMIDNHQAPEPPKWMDEIRVKSKKIKSNEKIFYSSGC